MMSKIGNKGFTLIELLVSMALFAVVIIVAVGAVLALARASDRSSAIITAIHNLDYAVEQMGRTIRVGTSYFCSNGAHPVDKRQQDCDWGDAKAALSFSDKDDQRILYKLNAAGGSLDRENLSEVPHRTFSITSPEIFIENMSFNVIGSSLFDTIQPRAMIRIKGRTVIPGLKDEDQVHFNLQTSVSQRVPDF